MPLPHRFVIVHAVIILFLVWIYTIEVEGFRSSFQCPIGFKLESIGDGVICYRKKGPEIFSDIYKDCSSNSFSLELYSKLNIAESNAVWTEYKNAYPGGPFLDMRFTDLIGKELDPKYEINFQNYSFQVKEDLCVVIDPVQKYMAVRCDEKHYRYCFVPPMSLSSNERTKEKCEDIKDSISFSAPIATCLTVLSSTTEVKKPGSLIVTVRATWDEAQYLCERKGGASLLNRGWRYTNDARLYSSKRLIYPMGIIMTSDHSLLRYNASGDHAEIPKSEWDFRRIFNKNNLLGACAGEKWTLVDSSYIFTEVICERTIKPRNVSIHLSVNARNELILNASEQIDQKDLYCFTDSDLKFPNLVKVHHRSDNSFVLAPKSKRKDGYYWCVYADPFTYTTVQSSKILFIREKDSLTDFYAVKLRSGKSYSKENIEAHLKKWEKFLREYIYYTTKYVQYSNNFPNENNTEEVLLNFKRSTGGGDLKDKNITRSVEVKRTYFDNKTVLLHVDLYPDMKAVMPGKWGEIEVLHMKPLYNCKELVTINGKTVPRMPMGQVTPVGRESYKCTGDFNEGVQWLQQPDEQLQQVMDDLDRLVNDTVYMENITTVFDQVNSILEVEQELEIPSRLLHLLDQLGATVQLRGEASGAAVGSSVALLAADAARDRPVRGLRVVDRGSDTFTNDTFEIMSEAVNSTTLNAQSTKAVVQLPDSVATSSRRISFVVFRNDRAFQPATPAGRLKVNSRVVSINVQNLTSFQDGETSPWMPQQRDSSDSSEESVDKKPPKTTTVACEEETSETVVTSTIADDAIISTVTTSTSVEEVITASTPVFTETTPTPTDPPPIRPDEQLQQVMDDLDRLVNDTVYMENITTVFDQVNSILEVQQELEIPSRLLHLLDQLGAAVQLRGAASGAAVGSSVALLAADAARDRPVRGLRVVDRGSDTFTDDTFEIMSEAVNSTTLNAQSTKAVVQLPDSVATSSRRISFVVFRNDRAFQPATPAGRLKVNSRVVSINVQNLTSFQDGEVIDIYIRPIMSNISRNESQTCAYWHFTDDNKTGYWSQEGCTFIRASRPGLLDTCRCVHLTHFAEILIPKTVFSERNQNALELISVIGCCISILGLIMVAVTAVLFRTWRRDFTNKIWLQLCISICVMSVCFLIIVFAKFDHYDIFCMLVGIALHYTVLTSFCWMLVAAVISYRRLVLVYTKEPSHKLLRASAFSYGAPCAVVAIFLSVSSNSYARRFKEVTPSGAFCYPSGLGLWLTVYAPIATMLLVNCILFSLIINFVFASKRVSRHGDTNEAWRCASVSCLLTFLFGLPWVFGLFASNIVAAYLFTILSTFQGFILFFFLILGNKKTRDMYKLKLKQSRKLPVTSAKSTETITGHCKVGKWSRMKRVESCLELRVY